MRNVFVAFLGALLVAAMGSQCQRAPAATAAASDVHGAHGPSKSMDTPMPADAGPVGYAPVSIAPDQAVAMRLATTPVEQRDFVKTLRTVGIIALDETRTAHVHSKVRGWIDGIHVDFVGRAVRSGEVLCSFYSQDVYSAEVELVSLLATASAEQDVLLEAARRRLALWDVPKSEIARLERTREPRRTFPLLAPVAGVVVAKQALDGMFVDPSVELYTLSDLSRVWVLVDVYEADVPHVRLGDKVLLRVEGQKSSVEARVSFLPPTLDEATRTRKVRLDLANPEHRFLPGAFVNAQMEVPMGSGLAIPESAVIRTGTRAIVFVAHGEQGLHLEPREVTLGPLVADHYRVDEGLSAGERVATGAQFLIDSESRLRATSEGEGVHGH
ncbi:MAG: efflux RND transporter periplasmic adaptor subunit [Myxococcota bacterium]